MGSQIINFAVVKSTGGGGPAAGAIGDDESLTVGPDGFVNNYTLNGYAIGLSADADDVSILIAGSVVSDQDTGIRVVDPGLGTSDFSDVVVTRSGTIFADNQGIDFDGSNNRVTVQGIVSADLNAIRFQGGAANMVTVSDGGILSARDVALDARASDALLVSNDGSITSQRFSAVTAQDDLTLTNFGSISGGTGIGAEGQASIRNSGSIDGYGTNGLGLGVSVDENSQIANSGTITGRSVGVQLLDDGSRLTNDGTISSDQVGIVAGDATAGGTNTIVNDHIIDGAAAGVDVAGGFVTLVNSGTINGTSAGINIADAGRGGTIYNTGTISSTNRAIDVDGNSETDVVRLLNTGVIAGRDTSTSSGSRYAVELSDGEDIVNNAGLIQGSVFMDAGDDVYNGAGGGTVTGRVLGGDGDDRFAGSAADDIFSGGDGDDRFTASLGSDSYTGGAGSDTVDFSLFEGPVTVNLGTGDFGRAAGNVRLSQIENVVGTRGDDLIGGSSGDNTLTGAGGNDTLFAGTGNDELFGGAGNDTLQGGGGDDVLNGGAGADTLDGQGGFDIADYSDQSAGLTVNLNKGVNSTGDTLTNIEGVTGGRGADVLGGNATANRLEGGNGNDLIFAGGGDDVLLGGFNDDTLLGGGGNDFLDGGAFGTDTLTGNAGADTFVANTALSTATVTDFEDGTDLIDVTAFDFTDTAATNDVLTSADSVTESGGNVVIEFGRFDTFTIENTTIAQLSDADFVI